MEFKAQNKASYRSIIGSPSRGPTKSQNQPLASAALARFHYTGLAATRTDHPSDKAYTLQASPTKVGSQRILERLPLLLKS